MANATQHVFDRYSRNPPSFPADPGRVCRHQQLSRRTFVEFNLAVFFFNHRPAEILFSVIQSRLQFLETTRAMRQFNLNTVPRHGIDRKLSELFGGDCYGFH